MNLVHGKSNEPHTTLDIVARDECGLLCSKVSETARVEAPLTVVSEEKVLSIRNHENLFGRVSAIDGVTVRFPRIDHTEIGLIDTNVALLGVSNKYVAVSDDDDIVWQTDDTLHIVFAWIRGRTKDDNVTTIRRAKEVAKLIDNDVLFIFKCIDHRASFNLEGGHDEGTDDGDNRHDDDDVERDIEQVKPEASLLRGRHGGEYRRHCTLPSMLESFFFKKHLDDDEVISLVVQKHWLIGLKNLFWPSLVFIAIWSALALSLSRYMIYSVSVAALSVLLWWIRNFMDYYLDAWLITNKGIVDLQWHGWFHRSSARVLYSDVQGVSYEVKGILGMLFSYGHMDIEKISTGSTISMDYVKKPRRVESVILENMERYVHSKNLKDATTVQTILAEFVAGSLQKKSVEIARAGQKGKKTQR